MINAILTYSGYIINIIMSCDSRSVHNLGCFIHWNNLYFFLFLKNFLLLVWCWVLFCYKWTVILKLYIIIFIFIGRFTTFTIRGSSFLLGFMNICARFRMNLFIFILFRSKSSLLTFNHLIVLGNSCELSEIHLAPIIIKPLTLRSLYLRCHF